MAVMASLIEAVIYDGGGTPDAVPPGARTVSLGGGLTLLPVTDDLAAQLDQSEAGDERICRAWMLRQPVAALTRRISAGRRALYACGQTFAGPGIQEAIGWRDGVLLFGPSGTCDLEADLEPGYHLRQPRRQRHQRRPSRSRGDRGPGHGRVRDRRAGQAPVHQRLAHEPVTGEDF